MTVSPTSSGIEMTSTSACSLCWVRTLHRCPSCPTKKCPVLLRGWSGVSPDPTKVRAWDQIFASLHCRVGSSLDPRFCVFLRQDPSWASRAPGGSAHGEGSIGASRPVCSGANAVPRSSPRPPRLLHRVFVRCRLWANGDRRAPTADTKCCRKRSKNFHSLIPNEQLKARDAAWCCLGTLHGLRWHGFGLQKGLHASRQSRNRDRLLGASCQAAQSHRLSLHLR